MNKAGLETAFANSTQFFFIVNQAAAGTTHRVGRAQDDRIAKFFCRIEGFLNGVAGFTLGHFNAQVVHGLFKSNAVFAPFDGIDLDTDNLDAVFAQDTSLIQFGTQIQAGLAAQVWQQRIRPFLFNNPGHAFFIQRFNIGFVSHFWIRHNRRRIGIDQNNFIAQTAQGFTGLCAGIVEFTSLANNNRTGADNQDFMDISSLTHMQPLSQLFLLQL